MVRVRLLHFPPAIPRPDLRRYGAVPRPVEITGASILAPAANAQISPLSRLCAGNGFGRVLDLDAAVFVRH